MKRTNANSPVSIVYWVMDVIKSCITLEQYRSAENLANLFLLTNPSPEHKLMITNVKQNHYRKLLREEHKKIMGYSL